MIEIDSNGGYISIGDFSISWGNSEELWAGSEERLEGYFSVNCGRFSVEFGCIDQEAPGIYFTKYLNGDVESSVPLIYFGGSR